MMFQAKFPTLRIFRIFHIFKINTTAPVRNLFIERPSHNHYKVNLCLPVGLPMDKNWMILLQQRFTAHVPLLTALSHSD